MVATHVAMAAHRQQANTGVVRGGLALGEEAQVGRELVAAGDPADKFGAGLMCALEVGLSPEDDLAGPAILELDPVVGGVEIQRLELEAIFPRPFQQNSHGVGRGLALTRASHEGNQDAGRGEREGGPILRHTRKVVWRGCDREALHAEWMARRPAPP